MRGIYACTYLVYDDKKHGDLKDWYARFYASSPFVRVVDEPPNVIDVRGTNNADIYVQDSEVRYLAPVWEDFVAQARLAEGESWDEFARALQARGRARLRVSCRVPLASGMEACVLNARFVAIVTP